MKTAGLEMFGHQLASADSQAWSRAARSRREPCELGKRDCGNCMHYALEWGDEVRALVGGVTEGTPSA